jgi:GxxExxY protein
MFWPMLWHVRAGSLRTRHAVSGSTGCWWLDHDLYDAVLAYELGRRGLRIVRQQEIPVVYEGIRIDAGFRADLIVEDK